MTFPRIFTLTAAIAFAVAAVAQTSTEPAVAEQAAPVTPLETSDAIAKAGDATAGEAKAAACGACHGGDGNSSDPQYPKLAGQHETYIARQLELFANGGRDNAIMLGFSAGLSAQDRRDIGAYYATKKVIPGVADDSVIETGPNKDKKFFEVGQAIYNSGISNRGIPACTACHGPAGAGLPGPTYPRIGGQHASYSSAKLIEFHGGAAWGTGDDKNEIMSQASRELTNEEILSLASYIEGLHRSSK